MFVVARCTHPYDFQRLIVIRVMPFGLACLAALRTDFGPRHFPLIDRPAQFPTGLLFPGIFRRHLRPEILIPLDLKGRVDFPRGLIAKDVEHANEGDYVPGAGLLEHADLMPSHRK